MAMGSNPIGAPMPASAQPPAPVQPASPSGGPMAALAQAHAGAKVQFAKLSAATTLAGKITAELAHLSSLGDTVTQDDVVESAGKLVTDGLPPLEAASLLADMPPGGEALQAWVASHTQAAAASAKALSVHQAIARHNMGMVALRELTGHAVIPTINSPAQGGDMTPPNALAAPAGPGAPNA